MDHRHSRLFHRGRGQSAGTPITSPGGVDMRDHRLIVLVDRDQAAFAKLDPDRLEAQSRRVAVATRGDEDGIAGDDRAGFEVEFDIVSRCGPRPPRPTCTSGCRGDSIPRRSAAEISWSRNPTRRSRCSITVTFTPSAANMHAYSQPITPPPQTRRFAGMSRSVRIVSESSTRGSWNGKDRRPVGRGAGRDEDLLASDVDLGAAAWLDGDRCGGRRTTPCPE